MNGRPFPGLICLFFAIASHAQYTDKTSKNTLFMNLCAGSTNPDVCVPLHFSYTVLKVIEAPCSDLLWASTCRATVLVGVVDKAIAIFFRGPSPISSWVSTAGSKISAMQKSAWQTYGSVGDDYATAFDRLWNQQGLGAYMQEVWSQYCNFALIVSGHSIGSCVAQMAVVEIKNSNMWAKKNIIYYGYGTPRCGDMDFAATVDASSNTRYRVLWLTDNIPMVPATTCSSTSNAVYGSSNTCWFHCCNAVWLKSSFLGFNTWKTCDLSEDTSCLGGTKTTDHTTYWSTKTSQYESLTCGSSMVFSPDK